MSTKHSIMRFIKIHKAATDTLSAGQRFCNMYLKEYPDGLFNEENEEKALRMIRDWLDQHEYADKLPMTLDFQKALSGVQELNPFNTTSVHTSRQAMITVTHIHKLNPFGNGN